jgi:hypothetical protein
LQDHESSRCDSDVLAELVGWAEPPNVKLHGGYLRVCARALESAVTGSNALALSYNSKTVNDTRSELGLRTDKSFAVNDAMLTLRGRAACA